MIDLKDNLDMEMIKRTINLARTIITNSLNLKQLIQTTEKPKGILDLSITMCNLLGKDYSDLIVAVGCPHSERMRIKTLATVL